MTQNSLYFFQLEMQSQVVGDETRIVKNSFMILLVYFERCDVISGKITQTPFSQVLYTYLSTINVFFHQYHTAT